MAPCNKDLVYIETFYLRIKVGSMVERLKARFGGVVLPFVHLPEKLQKVKNYMKQDSLNILKLLSHDFFFMK